MSEFNYMSRRAKQAPIDMEYIKTYSVYTALQNPYHEDSNQEGIINFGTAVSCLMDDVWLQRFSEFDYFKPEQSHFRYYQFWGPDDFRKNIASLMTTFFKPDTPVNFEDLFVLNGALVSLDILRYLLADDGDVFLCPTPAYSSYFQAGVPRWGIKMVSVPMTHNEETGEMFELTLEALEKVVSDELSKGRNVRALILNNPHNPTGIVFKPDFVKDIMKFCQRRMIHLVADEMYCMSVFNKDADFRSVLQLHKNDLLDPKMLHVIWGFSKVNVKQAKVGSGDFVEKKSFLPDQNEDLCLTGFRTGVIHTWNKDLQLALMSGSQFQAVPLPIMHILRNVISDISWFEATFVPKNHERLKKAYEKSKTFFDSLGMLTTTTTAGFYFLVDLRSLFDPPNEVNTKAFIKKLYSNKVYLTPSWDMRAEAGWFRFVFTAYSENGLETGLKRFKTAIEEWKRENPVRIL